MKCRREDTSGEREATDSAVKTEPPSRRSATIKSSFRAQIEQWRKIVKIGGGRNEIRRRKRRKRRRI